MTRKQKSESTEPTTDPIDPTEPAAAPDSAEARLRAFEDDRLGEDAPRHAGKLEQGHGSLFKRLSDEDQAHHAALAALKEFEQRVADARAELAEAEAACAEAEKRVEDTAAAAEAKKADDDAKASAKAARIAAKAPAA